MRPCFSGKELCIVPRLQVKIGQLRAQKHMVMGLCVGGGGPARGPCRGPEGRARIHQGLGPCMALCPSTQTGPRLPGAAVCCDYHHYNQASPTQQVR